MARYVDLIPNAQREAPEAPSFSVESEIKRAVIEFCRYSGIWRSNRVIETEAGVSEYRLRTERGGRVHDVLRVARVRPDGSESTLLARVGMAEIGRVISEYRAYSVNETTGRLVIASTPKSPGQLRVYAKLVPARDSQEFPDFIAEEWQDAIVQGALWKLLSWSNKPWSSRERSEDCRRAFYDEATRARQRAATDNWAAPVRIPRW